MNQNQQLKTKWVFQAQSITTTVLSACRAPIVSCSSASPSLMGFHWSHGHDNVLPDQGRDAVRKDRGHAPNLPTQARIRLRIISKGPHLKRQHKGHLVAERGLASDSAYVRGIRSGESDAGLCKLSMWEQNRKQIFSPSLSSFNSSDLTVPTHVVNQCFEWRGGLNVSLPHSKQHSEETWAGIRWAGATNGECLW